MIQWCIVLNSDSPRIMASSTFNLNRCEMTKSREMIDLGQRAKKA